MHRDRYYLLDAMRGVAALLVVFFHAGSFMQTNYAARGYLAVDFFFALSGFVITMSYGGRLRAGLSVWRFTMIRLIRFYPLFLVGLALGATKALGALFFADPQAISMAQITLSALWGIVMLPTLFAPHELYPLNGPAWSLFLEVAINVAFAAWFVRWRDSSLVFLAVIAALIMTIFLGHTGTLNGGWAWSTFGVGVTRITFAFTVGVLLARYSIHIERRVS
ncbi:acyltransferase family protein [Phyllobacterium brassicacearum]|nr:acyltransferase-like protein [Phyllobacterium brassicacearum]